MNNTGDTIYIIGRGAIGKALAVFLKTSGKNVVLLRGSTDKGEAHNEELQVTLGDSSVLNADIEVNTIGNIREFRGIVVLTSKSFANAELATTLEQKIGGSPLVILQNGLGVERPFIDNDFPSVYRCVLFVTSQNLGERSVRFKPVSQCPIGIVKGDAQQLQHVVTDLTTPNFQFRVETNIDLVIWRKAIINCAFNSICPMLDTDNGIFHRDAEALDIAKRVINECLVIAGKKGIQLNASEVVENLLLISRASDGQLISTLQDIRNKQPTEIDTLNFEIARMAEHYGLADHVQETRLLGELTRLKSKLTR